MKIILTINIPSQAIADVITKEEIIAEWKELEAEVKDFHQDCTATIVIEDEA